MHSVETPYHQGGMSLTGRGIAPCQRCGGHPSLREGRKERVGELVALCSSVAWLINYHALLLPNSSLKEMVFLQAKDGFSTSCQLLQFLQRGSLLKTLHSAAESSSSSFDVHIEMEYHVCRLSVILMFCLLAW